MIAVIKTVHDNYNIFGTRDEMFCIQGNLNKEELIELRKQIDEALEEE